MEHQIRRAAVIGSGIMGSGIAAHLANIGIPTLMLDIVPQALTAEEESNRLSLESKAVRNRLSDKSKKALTKQKPSPITTKKSLELISTGNLEDDLDKLAEVDWIIEVVVENLSVKKKVLNIIDEHRKTGSIVSSNTSGISLEQMVRDCSDDLKENFLGTHFFNPPRYLKLLEVIPTKWTNDNVLSYMKQFGEDRLGKGVVEAKDTPNFIANRIGTYGLLVTVREMLEQGLSVGEVDSVTGPMIGRPKSATFRTLDVVGLDTFAHVANNVFEQVDGKEKEIFRIPDFMAKMLDHKWLGAKTGQGFFLKQKKEGKSIIYQLNPQTMEYEDNVALKTKATALAKQEKGTKRKMKALLSVPGDPASNFVWSIIKPVLMYSAELKGVIADDILSIDQAMRWGFGWELGPFELWDALGFEATLNRMVDEGEVVPDWITEMKDRNVESFYKKENGCIHFYDKGEYKEQVFNHKEINLHLTKQKRGVIKQNTGASLIDIGDGVACLEFQSKSNAIGMDILQMINQSIEEVDKNYEGLVIGNQGKNFCVGANIAMMLMEAQDGNFFEIDMVVRKFQNTMMQIKYASKPVVVAPFGMTLGGGAEVSLPASSLQAAQETYMGLVEFGVGLIPGGGGNKELYLKHIRNLPDVKEMDLLQIANTVFETIAMAKVSTSAQEARENGFLNRQDGISTNQSHLIHDAKQKVLSLRKAGYVAPEAEKVPVVGEAGYAAMLLGAKHLAQGGYASEHDLKMAEKLAFVIAGGKIKQGTYVDEQYLLDIEREAFLSLIGEPKTQARMQHMLMKGNPLRN
ncbi:3-hydroxyacyl-CoA dehydrogenase/enoyl-CoA hydratase family protein [Aquibacillus koreensis]|uniref:3-hydroxyacyl-CoA dehydrogenase/enoyl-CoA hydratase family protein n=1 Tax=Aquibacillus koreensis TaxID=279446 RepID=A0A9X3WIH7_9BACI|nr:3-hydroxyacyl-CoA dehydrogenase/enoyl-CoA hydratase family protein [Aquibacillus koreensis]MCT2535936.1 3-hydroxyacyl-CoA dehydrogenase/enoyl-CoA hydratase family protein [Aquibacillus koreensis]MDC3420392.1 3-hydroxyacyl-CoA dehydrogenase/enoyl-CoA hydratase family protein [Aquibacillus koreensis]